MTLPGGLRLWARLAGSAALLIAVWLLLAPITVVYLTAREDPAPQRISTLYSWWTADQDFIFSDTGLGQQMHLINGVRLNCGNVFTTGPYERRRAPDGPQACADVETPRCLTGLTLLGAGLVGLLLARQLSAGPGRNRYSVPYQQRRARWRAG